MLHTEELEKLAKEDRDVLFPKEYKTSERLMVPAPLLVALNPIDIAT